MALLRYPVSAAASVAATLAVLALVGHLTDTATLTSAAEGLPKLSPHTATSVLLLATAFLSRHRWQPAIAAGALGSGLLALVVQLGGFEAVAGWASSPTTGLLVMAVASAILVERRFPRTATVVAGVTTAVAWLFAVSLLLGADSLYEPATVIADSGTSLPTATALGILALGWAARDVDLRDKRMQVLATATLGSIIAVPVLTLVSGWIGLTGSTRAAIVVTVTAAGPLLAAVLITAQAQRTATALAAVEDVLLTSASHAIVIVDPTGTIVRSNAQAAELFGYLPDVLNGMKVEMLVPDAARPRHAQFREGYLGDPHARPMGERDALHVRRADGSEAVVRISLMPIDQPSGPPFVAATVVDVTGLARQAEDAESRATALQDALEHEVAALDRLRELDRAKDLLLTAVSHELRTPLTALLGMSEILARPDRATDPATDALLRQRVHRQARRLAVLIDDLLDLDNRQLDRSALPERTRVDVLVRRGAESATTAFAREFRVDVPPVEAWVDPKHLERIIDNLLSNACKYAPTGPIHIDARLDTDHDRVFLAVEDEGVGVDEALRETIWDPFERGAAVDAAQPGVGIGLALVRRLVTANEGDCWVETGPRSGGARFVVELPMRAAVGGVAQPAARAGDFVDLTAEDGPA